MDGTLYYVHQDHLGCTVALSDADGQAVGRVQYDPYGEVFTSTLPVTLTEQLLSSQGLDSQLGLVYHGDGRWYDPSIAHSLQPDPFGGVPQLPQTLNRYAVTPAGASGVGQVSPGLHPLLAMATKGAFKTLLSTAAKPARQRTLNVAIQSLLASTIGRSRPTGMTFVQLMGKPEAFTGAFANLKLLRSDTYPPLPPQGMPAWLLPMVVASSFYCANRNASGTCCLTSTG